MTTIERKRAAAAKARAAKSRRRKPGRNDYPQPKEPIDPVKAYPLALCPGLLGISRETLRAAQRDGLRTIQIGSRKFVEGVRLIEFMRKKAASTN